MTWGGVQQVELQRAFAVSDRVGPHTLRQCEASLWDCFVTHLSIRG
jgi:hypothetical protein